MKATLLVLMAACGSPTLKPDAEIPMAFPMRVIVSSGAVQIYTDAKDIVGCGCQPFVFPEAGGCSGYTDGNPCEGNPFCSSCVTDFGVEQDGALLTPRRFDNDPLARGYDIVTEAPLTLVLEGCGHPSTRIPVDGAAFPTVAVFADQAAAGPHASWTTDASEALVTLDAQGGPSCHVANANDYTFMPSSSATGVEVMPLGSRVELDTAFGHATIWRASYASAQLPAP